MLSSQPRELSLSPLDRRLSSAPAILFLTRMIHFYHGEGYPPPPAPHLSGTLILPCLVWLRGLLSAGPYSQWASITRFFQESGAPTPLQFLAHSAEKPQLSNPQAPNSHWELAISSLMLCDSLRSGPLCCPATGCFPHGGTSATGYRCLHTFSSWAPLLPP